MDKIESLRSIVLQSANIEDLYYADVELTEIRGFLYKDIALAQTNFEQMDLKKDLSLVNTLIGICRERQKTEKDKTARFNHNFRMAAKEMLERGTYAAIYDAALKPRNKR